ncbi:acetate--CoA ligase family protein [Roseomonas sp. E05]|uniref:acetate--CoA ligase family protein n=1 Tax=Roseomonas sp. E05 TaxID=3046310 RepID=UPI0024B94E19|nr:acetate--CoA ligase family protein [Roseomonas sp. E05]MDJ0389560.1 acetate--CoA ligase family protein [Roseomonas sp. E05]
MSRFAPERLRRFLQPRSVAIVGATSRAGAFGARVLENLSAFQGRIHLVNPRYREIDGRACHPNLAALPEAPDCVAIATPREGVAAVLEEAIAAGAGGLVVFAAGFAETGLPERMAAQAALSARAAGAGLPLLGPNCLGFAHFGSGAGVTFSAGPPVLPPAGLRPPAIGIASQSGAVGFALAQAVERGVPVSHVLTSGNAAGLDIAELVAFLADAPDCAAIACVLEGAREPRRLLEAIAQAEAAGKPVVVHKMASGQSGAAAALSHTGAVAGGHAVWRAALAGAGAAVVEDLGAVMEMASFLARAPAVPKGAGVAVVSTSGGACILAADAAERHGVALPQPGEAAQAVLGGRIPEYGSARNPCDLTAQVLNDPEALAACTGALARDPAFGLLLYPNTHAYPFSLNRLPVMAEIAAREGRFLCVPWVAERREGDGAATAEAVPGAALFASVDRCFAAIAAWQARAARRARPPDRPSARLAEAQHARVAALLEGGPVLTESRVKAVLAACSVPVVPELLAQDADEAVAAAEGFGFPVVLKAESPALPHKTEAGVVRLNLRDAAELRAAYAAILASAARAAPGAAIDGVLVQPMLPAGLEVMLGAHRDPLFGPVVAVGLGGVLVELLEDVAVAPAPLSPARARAMLEGLRGARLLQGFRGAAPVDLERLAEIVCRIGELVVRHPRIRELDVNPLICGAQGIVAVDGLIALSVPGEGEEE